jgi:signal transduction histidine kinase
LIGNLVDNAMRYGRAGGEVTLGVRQSPTTIFVRMMDRASPLRNASGCLIRFTAHPGAAATAVDWGWPSHAKLPPATVLVF